VLKSIDDLNSYIKSTHNIVRSFFDIGNTARRDEYLIDQEAFREGWINACLHNDYSRHLGPAVYLFSDHLEIFSYGNPLTVQTKDDFLRGVSVPINPELTNIFMKIDKTEASGKGVNTIVKKYGIDVFEFSETHLTIKIPYNVKVLESIQENTQETGKDQSIAQENTQEIGKDQRITQEIAQEIGKDQRITQEIAQETEKDQRITQENTQETGKDQSIAQENTQEIGKDQRITQENTQETEKDQSVTQENTQETGKDQRITQEITQEIGKDQRITQEITQETEKDQRITQEIAQEIGKDQRITQEITQETGKNQRITQEITQETIESKILKIIKEEPTITKNILSERLKTSPDSIKYYLNKMRKNGLIKHKGPTKSGYWEIVE